MNAKVFLAGSNERLAVCSVSGTDNIVLLLPDNVLFV